MSTAKREGSTVGEQLGIERVRLAESMAAAGFILMPLAGKKPIPTGWTDLAAGTYKPALHFKTNNYGVVLTKDILVVDADPRNSAAGDQPLLRLLKDIGCPQGLKTFTVQTGGGGLHIYLKKPEALANSYRLKAYQGIEFSSYGHQVVGPGSVHPDTGVAYKIVAGAPGTLASAPEALLKLIEKTEVAPAAKGTGGAMDDAAAVARFHDYLATAPVSVQGNGGEATAFKVACVGRDYGLSAAVTLSAMAGSWNMRCQPPWELGDLDTKVQNAYKYASSPLGNAHPAADFDTLPAAEAAIAKAQHEARKGKSSAAPEEEITWKKNKDGIRVKCFHNLLNYFKISDSGLRGVFGLNEFTGNIEVTTPAPWHNGHMPAWPAVVDHDLVMLKTYLVKKFDYEASIEAVQEAITSVSYTRRFHPVREYLNSLKWDGVKRLDTWLTRYAAVEDTPYTRAAGRKVLCAAVQRVFRPGCQFDHVLILEGKQKLGKTSLCRILGGDWYGAPTIDPHNKDTVQALQGKWIIEMAEMEVTKRAETRALKAFITSTADRARLAYGRLARDFQRQCIFIGTINPGPDGTYLKDNTGNRRFWPVEMRGLLDFKGLKDSRDQLFAEAVAAVRAGESIYMDTRDLEKAAEDAAAERHADHPWKERIQAWLEEEAQVSLTGGKAKRNFVTARDVFIEAMGGIDKQLDRKVWLDVAEVMQSLGWEKTMRRAGGVVTRGYARPHTLASVKTDGLEGWM